MICVSHNNMTFRMGEIMKNVRSCLYLCGPSHGSFLLYIHSSEVNKKKRRSYEKAFCMHAINSLLSLPLFRASTSVVLNLGVTTSLEVRTTLSQGSHTRFPA